MSDLLAFDWNGTLVDDLDRAVAATSLVATRRGLPAVTPESFREGFRLPLAEMFSGMGVDARDLVAAEREWNAEMRASRAPLSRGAADVLDLARRAGWRVGVVSAAATEAVLDDVRALGLDGAFDFVWGAQADKAAALGALRDAQSGLVVYVGDTEYDIECARAADVVGIAYGAGYRPADALRAAGPRAVIGSLVELTAVLDGVLASTPRASSGPLR